MVLTYVITGLLLGVLSSWLLYGIPASDGYDLLALVVVTFAAFDTGMTFPESSSWRKVGAGILFVLIFTSAFLSFAISPYLLGAAYLFYTIGGSLSWWIDRVKSPHNRVYALFSSISLIFTIFVFLFFA